MFIFLCICVYVCMCMRACMWKPKVDVRCHPLSPATSFFETLSLTEANTHQLDRLAGQWFISLLPHTSRSVCLHSHEQLLTWALRIWTHGLTLTWQARYPLSCLWSPFSRSYEGPIGEQQKCTKILQSVLWLWCYGQVSRPFFTCSRTVRSALPASKNCWSCSWKWAGFGSYRT